jgi:hypothetical protein
MGRSHSAKSWSGGYEISKSSLFTAEFAEFAERRREIREKKAEAKAKDDTTDGEEEDFDLAKILHIECEFQSI